MAKRKKKEERWSLDKCKEATCLVPKRRRFSVLYVHYPKEICHLDGQDFHKPDYALYQLDAEDWQKESVAKWMAACEKGGSYICGRSSSVVIVRSR